MRRFVVSLPILALTFAAACDPGPEPTPTPKPNPIPIDPNPRTTVDVLDLGGFENAYGLDGVAVDKNTGDVHALVGGVGIVIRSSDGSTERTIPFSETFPDQNYGDIDLLPDGSYVLAGPVDALRFDPEAGTLVSYFCLVPGWEEIILVNRAVGVDPVDGDILAAPTYYDTSIGMETPSEAYHAHYKLNGDLANTVDVLSSGVVAEGLARDPGSEHILAVDGNLLVAFQSDGSVAAAYELEGITDASGLAIDSVAEVVYVTDRFDFEARTFDLADFR